MTARPEIPLGEVAVPVERPEVPIPGRDYRQVGVRLWGQGAYERELLDGGMTKYKTLNRVEAGDIIVNKIWARNGSVAVVTDELAGCFCSSEFPTFAPSPDKLVPRWFHWITETRWFWDQCDEKSRGTSGKNRIRPERFLEVTIPLPPLPEQRRIVARIEELASKQRDASRLVRSVECDGAALLARVLGGVVAGVARTAMADVAPVVRRAVRIDPAGQYPELGIRSFGNGTFHKTPLSGLEVGTKRLFRIEPGAI